MEPVLKTYRWLEQIGGVLVVVEQEVEICYPPCRWSLVETSSGITTPGDFSMIESPHFWKIELKKVTD